MMLSLLGVPHEEIASDYLFSDDPDRDKLLQERGTNAREVILDTLKQLDIEDYLLGAAVSQEELDKLRDRDLEKINVNKNNQ